MSTVSISVVVCTYNRDKFIRDCLVGLSEQDCPYDQFEVVLVNNNSTDQTEAIVHQYMDDHPELPINYFLEEQQGLSYARNRGIAEAKGGIITFIDDDAIPMPDFVRRITDFFASQEEAIAVGGKVIATFESERPVWANRFSESLYFSHYDKGDQMFRYKKSYPIGCNMSFRRSFFYDYAHFNPALGRKGKSGDGFEEKELFAIMRRENLPHFYDPRQQVLHQIDDDRLSVPYQEKLALGLGHSNHKMFCEEGSTWTCIVTTLSILAKYVAAIILAVGYWLIGRPAVSRHLIRFRSLVLKGFWKRMSS